MPSADFWQAIRNSHESLSPDSGTSARPPGVSSPAFSAQPLDLQPESLMDMGLSVSCPLARLGMPRIQFLFVGSRLCSTLLSDPLSRMCPCVSLRLHLHQVGEGTFTPKLVNMPSTQKGRPGGRPAEAGKEASRNAPGDSRMAQHHGCWNCRLRYSHCTVIAARSARPAPRSELCIGQGRGSDELIITLFLSAIF